MAFDIRPVGLILGLLLITLAVSMSLPAALDLLAGNEDWLVFAAAGAATLFVGLAAVLTCRTGPVELNIRQTFLTATLAWVVTAAFAALPFYFSGQGMGRTDSYFEAMSGLTTTGATVLSDLHTLPPGLLLWRAILQWLGGIGVIVLAVAVLPLLNIGGMQMFRLEGADASEKIAPRAARVATSLALVYAGLTLALTIALSLAGMSGFEALVHAMTSISTGGFSTSDASVGSFNNGLIEVIITIGMLLGGMPFLFFLLILQNRRRGALRDQQVHWYLGILLLATSGLSLWLWISQDLEMLAALRYGAFTTVSVMTGTGFFTIDWSHWAGLPLAILFFIALVGGCAGSTTAGIKVFRVQILVAGAQAQLQRLLRPHSVVIPYYNRRSIPDSVMDSVMGFLFVFALSYAVLAMGLAFMGLDFATSVSGAAAALANVGPGIGATIGPGQTYADLPGVAKWFLSVGMVLGRLELFTVLVLFVPTFWRN
ncbi:TrkH family potassium uptake protein [Telmatospirillum sp. J64-1]|uniref:TrkH family potassium uptake protein n=1 Tax=Telmatospirillum sp. J64-1 TaxID=2502183 RepID=UPI00115F3B49|nr:TrkH family potassium uptake protein [Telmatospirillum sp. J64-1]